MNPSKILKEEERSVLFRFLEVFLPAFLVIGPLLLFFELRRLKYEFLSVDFLFHLLIYFIFVSLFVFRKKMGIDTVIRFVLVLIISDGLYSLLTYGIEGRIILALGASCIFVHFVYGSFAGICLLAGIALSIFIKGLLIEEGYLTLNSELLLRFLSSEVWIISAISFLLYLLPLLFFFGHLRNRLSTRITELAETNERLQDEIRTRESAERKFSTLEELFASMMKIGLAGFFVLDGTNFLFCNSRTCEILGRDHEKLKGSSLLDFIHPEERDSFKEILSMKAHGERTLRCIRDDGNVLTLLISIERLKYQERHVISGVMIDVTKEKNLEAQLFHAQKMEAIGTFAEGIAHDFGNMLTAVAGYASLARSKIENDSPVRPYIDRILSSSGRAASLIRDLLTFGRRDPVDVRAVTVKSLIEDAENLIRRLMPEDTEIRVYPPQEEMAIMCDRTKMEQVLLNLAANARDAMTGDAKAFTVRAEKFEMDALFTRTFGFGKPGTYVLLSISDTGCGMDEHVRKRIFEPFFTTKEGGTGLGMSIVYSIVKDHGGYITVESEKGQGTTFKIYIPILEGKNPPEEIEDNASISTSHRGETILLAEDDEDIRRMLEDVLTHAGYHVITARDGEEALRTFIDVRDKVDMVLVDSVMPRRSGESVIREIRKTKPTLPCIIMSGYQWKGGEEEARTHFIPKPLNVAELLRKIREMLDAYET